MNKELSEQFIMLMTKCSKFNTAFPSMCGLPVNEMRILHMISEAGPDSRREGTNLDMQNMQEQLQISKPAISYNLNMLEKKEYIVREIDTRDRRRISVRITEKGTSAWEDSVQQHENLWDTIVEKFGESDMNQLTQLLTRFFEVLNSILERENPE